MRSENVVLCIALGLGAATALASDRDLKLIPIPAAQGTPAGAPGKLVLLRGTESRVEVGRDGKVLAVQSDPALPAAVAQALEQNIRRIAFAPPMKDGEPVAGVTYVQQDACAVSVDGAYRMAVKLRGNGPSLVQRFAPRYPFDALRGQESATYQVEYDVATDGSVTMHSVTRSEGGRRYGSQFTQAIESWVEAQRFAPEQLAGEPVGTRIATTVEFTSNVGPPRSKMLAKLQAQDASCQAALAEPPAPDRRVAVNSPFHPLAVD